MVIAVVVLQLGFIARGYWSDHKEFAFQMFPESSTWRADVVRVTADGQRIPIERPWSGYRWDELVQSRGLRFPSFRHHADAGLANQLAFLEASLDWVADNTPRDRETQVSGGDGHVLAQRRPAAGPGRAEPRARRRSVNATLARVRPVFRGLTAALDELLGREVSMRALAVLRIPAGAAVLLHLRPFLSDGLDGRIYRDAFYEPYAAWYPELPREAYLGLLWLGAAAAVAMSLGFATRVATATTFAIVAYNVFLSTTHFHNNRAYLLVVLALLAVAPCGRELSADASARRRRGQPALSTSAPAWPLWLLRFECAAVYGASGLSKLLDPDWFGGTVTWQRVSSARDQLEAWPLPDWAVSLLTDRGFHTGAAKFVVLTELFIAAGLLVAAHPVRGRVGRRRLPPRDRAVGGGPDLLVPRHRRAGDLGRAVHP